MAFCANFKLNWFACVRRPHAATDFVWAIQCIQKCMRFYVCIAHTSIKCELLLLFVCFFFLSNFFLLVFSVLYLQLISATASWLLPFVTVGKGFIGFINATETKYMYIALHIFVFNLYVHDMFCVSHILCIYIF